MGCLLGGVMKVLQHEIVAQSCEYNFKNGHFKMLNFMICELYLNKVNEELEGLYVLRWYNIQNILNEKEITEVCMVCYHMLKKKSTHTHMLCRHKISEKIHRK